jgi:hypothetical protein
MSAISSELSLQQVHSRTIIVQFNCPTLSQIRQKYFAHKPANPMTLLFDREECKDVKSTKDIKDHH